METSTVSLTNQSPLGQFGKLPLEIRRLIYRHSGICGTYIVYGPNYRTKSMPLQPRLNTSILRTSKALKEKAEHVQYEHSVFKYEMYCYDSTGGCFDMNGGTLFMPDPISQPDLTRIRHIKIELGLRSFPCVNLKSRAIANKGILACWDASIGKFIESLPRRRTCVVTSVSAFGQYPPYVSHQLIPGSAVIRKVLEVRGFEWVELEMRSQFEWVHNRTPTQKGEDFLGPAFCRFLFLCLKQRLIKRVSMVQASEIIRRTACGLTHYASIKICPGILPNLDTSDIEAADRLALADKIADILNASDRDPWYEERYLESWSELSPLLDQSATALERLSDTL